ncbi:MAG TPA: DUF3426 domain-containing protein [Steroidobacteraceae bacterium]|nr:DUF3426 domain-containing protein [Steroidobacteraceae bacterium]
MYSQCPDCQTRFRVTAEALRTARGTVRCGRCGSAFDALERLSDSIPAAVAEVAPVPLEVAASLAAASAAPVTEEIHFSAEDLERVFVDERDWQAQFGVPRLVASPTEQADGSDEAPVVVDEDSRFEDITLEGERIAIDTLPESGSPEIDFDAADRFEIPSEVAESAAPPEDDRELEELVQQLTGEFEPLRPKDAAAPVPAPDPAAGASALPEMRPAAIAEIPLASQRWRPQPQAAEAVTEPEDEPNKARPEWRAFAWTAGSVVLALVLAAQLIHHYRQDLVRHPQLGAPLRATYEGLGIPLMPNWDLAAIELRQWGNESEASGDGRLVVRASLTNRAAFAQPHPILRLELDDRFGATVATRDFEPADYLKDPSQATRLIAPGSMAEAELVLADPGTEAVGYRLDACLRESATLLRCASGPG